MEIASIDLPTSFRELVRTMNVNEFSNLATEVLLILEHEVESGLVSGGKMFGNFVELNAVEKLAVVGDLHGDFETLHKILDRIDYENLLTNPRNKLIFLGDYVDRGSESLGVLSTVFALKKRYQSSVILMRGNHESPSEFPFASHHLPLDIQERFGETEGKKLYELILSLFSRLTLAVLLHDRILLVHGGLPTDIAPDSDFRLVLGDAQAKGTPAKNMEELLWNDPRSSIQNNSEWEMSRRGIGRHFGPTVSSRWLKMTGAKIIVRGHEPCPGFRIDHGGLVLTLFSAKEAYDKFEAAYLFLPVGAFDRINSAYDLLKYITLVQ